jgi:hypothetical protein
MPFLAISSFFSMKWLNLLLMTKLFVALWRVKLAMQPIGMPLVRWPQSAFIAVSASPVFGIEDSLIEELIMIGASSILFSQLRKFKIEANRVLLEILQQLESDTASVIKFFDKLAIKCGECRTEPALHNRHHSFNQRRPCLNKHHQPKILERQLPIWELLKDKQVLHKLDGRSRQSACIQQ